MYIIWSALLVSNAIIGKTYKDFYKPKNKEKEKKEKKIDKFVLWFPPTPFHGENLKSLNFLC